MVVVVGMVIEEFWVLDVVVIVAVVVVVGCLVEEDVVVLVIVVVDIVAVEIRVVVDDAITSDGLRQTFSLFRLLSTDLSV